MPSTVARCTFDGPLEALGALGRLKPRGLSLILA